MVVPAVVMWIIIALSLLFIGTVFSLTYKSYRYGRVLKAINRTLSSESRHDSADLDQATLEKVGQTLQGSRLFSHGWREFHETIVTDHSSTGETKFYNTRQAEEFFPEEQIVDASVSPSFFGAIPGILTSLGLLGTFVAILFGLSVVHVPSGVDAGKIEGIDTFVNALSGKFLSSVIALALAILFTIFQNLTLNRAHNLYRGFCQGFDAVFPRRTAEEVLMQMNDSIEQQATAFQHFNTDLAANFKAGVTEGLGPVLERIVEGLQSITGERDTNIETLLERLTTEFRSSMSQSAGAEFDQISSTMGNAAQLMERANTQSERTQSSFQDLMAAMEQSKADQVALAEKQKESMNEMLSTVTTTMESVSNRSQNAADARIQEMIEKSRQEARESANAVEQTLTRYSDQINQQVQELCQRVDQSAQSIASAGETSSRDLLESIQSASQNLEQSTSRVLEKTGAVSEKLTDEISQVLSAHRESVGTLTETQTALKETLTVWNEGTAEMRNVLTPLRDSVTELHSISRMVENASAHASESQEKASEIITGANAGMQRLEEMRRTSENLLKEHQRVFEVVEKGLSGTLSVISDKIQSLQEVSARGLSDQLKEFDGHLGRALSSLGGAVGQLEESMEDAAERIAKAGSKS